MDYSSVTRLKVDAWNGSDKSDGSFDVRVSYVDVPGGGTDEDRERIRKTSAYQKVLEFHVQNQQVIFQKIMDAARKEYDMALADKDAYDPEMVFPEVSSQDDLKEALVAPLNIHIGFTSDDEVDSVGYSFSCSWDEEHGFGVRFKGLDVVDSGYADVVY